MTEPYILFADSALPLPAYWLALAAAFLLSAACLFFQAKAQKQPVKLPASFLLLALPLALLLGRLIYSLVQMDQVFFDEMGEYAGLAAFFRPSSHGFSVVGVLLGVLLASLLAAKINKTPVLGLLDLIAAPGALLFALARLAEPLNAQGYGEAVEHPLLQFFPLSILNEMGDRLLNIAFIEALLALLILVCLLVFRRQLAVPGRRAVFFLVFFTLSQIIPESLRRDDALFIFIFARVTQVGYMLVFAGVAVYLAIRERKLALPGVKTALYSLITLLLIGLCILCEFALDKSNLSKLLVYAVMACALVIMAALSWARMLKERKTP